MNIVTSSEVPVNIYDPGKWKIIDEQFWDLK